MIKNIIFLAPPASGKGTQAKLLKDKYNMCHISTGDLLREACSRDDEFGENLKRIMQSGNLVDDSIVLELLKKKVMENLDSGFILDGFPRNVNQALALDELLKEINKKIDYVLYLNVPKNVLQKRITGRRLCKICGKIYNIYQDNISLCTCGGELYQRSDDNLESFENRYQEYIEKTQPLIDYYNKNGNLISIDGDNEVEQIFDQITSILNN